MTLFFGTKQFWIFFILLFMIPREGFVGTYGDYRETYHGLNFFKDINIGSYQDHDEEMPKLKLAQKEIKKSWDPIRKDLKTIADILPSIKNPYRKFLKLMNPKGVDYQGSSLYPFEFYESSIRTSVSIASGLKQTVRAKITANVVLSQLAPDGYYRKFFDKTKSCRRVGDDKPIDLRNAQRTLENTMMSQLIEETLCEKTQIFDESDTSKPLIKLARGLIENALTQTAYTDAIYEDYELSKKDANASWLLFAFARDLDFEKSVQLIKSNPLMKDNRLFDFKSVMD